MRGVAERARHESEQKGWVPCSTGEPFIYMLRLATKTRRQPSIQRRGFTTQRRKQVIVPAERISNMEVSGGRDSILRPRMSVGSLPCIHRFAGGTSQSRDYEVLKRYTFVRF